MCNTCRIYRRERIPKIYHPYEAGAGLVLYKQLNEANDYRGDNRLLQPRFKLINFSPPTLIKFHKSYRRKWPVIKRITNNNWEKGRVNTKYPKRRKGNAVYRQSIIYDDFLWTHKSARRMGVPKSVLIKILSENFIFVCLLLWVNVWIK